MLTRLKASICESEAPMRVLGPETDEARELREWFEAQTKQNLERLEEGAKTIIQLVSGLYGVLFAVLALNDQPAYLQQQGVPLMGTVSLVAFFAALVSAVAVVLPRRIPYQQDHLTAMHRAYQRLLAHKSGWLRGALLLFVVGTAALGGVVVLVLWQG
jgi:hypothetical protein